MSTFNAKSSAKVKAVKRAINQMCDAVETEKKEKAEAQSQASRERSAFLEVSSAAFIASFDTVAKLINSHMHAQGFWESDNTGEKIALMHSELSEALEADRKNISESEHIPDFTGIEEELADTVIRILDFSAFHGLRLAEAVIAKSQFNLSREHKHDKAY
jgi:NTP pyrophosphatase (non-canonical NTP hydrolase)